MKKTQIIVMLILTSCFQTAPILAQVQKGTVFVGGSSNLQSNSSSTEFNAISISENSGTQFNLLPQASYYISNNWALGLGFRYRYNYSFSVSNGPQFGGYYNQERIDNNFGISLMARYNRQLSKRFAFFVQGVVTEGLWGKGKNIIENMNGGIGNKTITEIEYQFGKHLDLNIDVRPGISYFITPRFGLEATFASVYFSAFSAKSSSVGGTLKSSGYNMGYNLFPNGFSMAANFYFHPKPKAKPSEELEQ